MDGLVDDVTERKHAEEARRDSEERLRTLVESLTDFSLFMLDAAGRVVSWNAEAEQMTGYPASEIVGRHVASFYVPETAGSGKAERDVEEASRGRFQDERWCRRRDGSTFWARVVLTPLRDRAGDLLGFSTVIRDVTERRRAEEHLIASEARLAGIIGSAMDSIITINADERIVVFNAAAEKMFRCPASEAIGQPIDRFLPAPHLRALDGAGATIPAAGEVGTLTALRANGEEFPLEATVSQLDAAGQKLYTVIMRDVTERMRTDEERVRLLAREQAARAQAEAAQRRLAFLAEASSVLGASLDAETTLTSLAPLAIPDLGDWCLVDLLEDEESVRRLAIAHLDPSRVAQAWELNRGHPGQVERADGITRVLRTGRAEIQTGHAAGSLLAPGEADAAGAAHGVRGAIIVPLTARGRTFGALTFLSAESGRRYGSADLALAEELARRAALAVDNARLYRDAQEASRAKDEFLATISHELRTPLTSIVGWVAMLRAGRLDASTAARALDVIERNAKLQAQLVEDLLDVSRIITGKLRLEMRQLDLVPVIEAAIESVESAANAKGIRIESVLDPQAGFVSGDAARLQQVLWNLLSNAIKFTPASGRVEVRLARDDGQATITVSDSGQGIPPDALPRLFDRFWQVEGTRARAGLGLGLAIVRHLVEVHGGRVYAASAGEGRGASFTVRLPLLAPRFGQRSRTWGPSSRDAEGAEDHLSLLEGLRILVVDDEDDSRELVATLFQEGGADVVAAASASEAWQTFQRWPPDVLVADLRMPGESGYDLLERIRSLGPERGGAIPAVALTAQAGEEERQRALSAGFHVHVVKPVEPAHLTGVVARLVAERRQG